jgi:hypothetical protein
VHGEPMGSGTGAGACGRCLCLCTRATTRSSTLLASVTRLLYKTISHALAGPSLPSLRLRPVILPINHHIYLKPSSPTPDPFPAPIMTHRGSDPPLLLPSIATAPAILRLELGLSTP